MDIKIIKSDKIGKRPADSELGFGSIFTDHMFNMDYSAEDGWHNARIEPYSPLTMDPATMVLHYGQAIFEGLKAFKTESGDIKMYRPYDNMKRMNRSARRLCIPEFDEEFVMNGLKKLIEIEKDWVPENVGTALYIRPTIVAMDPFLGVRASNTYRFFIILSPVGAYYATGFNPVKILVTKDYVRAVRGGVGDAKTAGNYAASLLAGTEAAKEGYNQVMWLDGVERKYIEEVGAMNIFFVINDEIITPELTGSILPGITRDSVLKLAKSWNMKITERKISIDEVVTAYKDGNLKEVFGSGTAAVISPVGTVKYDDLVMTINNDEVGPVADKFYKALTDIQYGKIEDTEGWIEQVC